MAEDKLSPEELNRQLAAATAMKIMKEGGLAVASDIVKSTQKPAEALGLFMAQASKQLEESLGDEMGVPAEAIYGTGGAMHTMGGIIKDALNVPNEVMADAAVIATQALYAADLEPQGQQGQQAPMGANAAPQAPAAPQRPVLPQGGVR